MTKEHPTFRGIKFRNSHNIWGIGRIMLDLATLSLDEHHNEERLENLDQHAFARNKNSGLDEMFPRKGKPEYLPVYHGSHLWSLIKACVSITADDRPMIPDLKRQVQSGLDGCREQVKRHRKERLNAFLQATTEDERKDQDPAKLAKVYFRANEINDMPPGPKQLFDANHAEISDLMTDKMDIDWPPLRLPDTDKWRRVRVGLENPIDPTHVVQEDGFIYLVKHHIGASSDVPETAGPPTNIQAPEQPSAQVPHPPALPPSSSPKASNVKDAKIKHLEAELERAQAEIAAVRTTAFLDGLEAEVAAQANVATGVGAAPAAPQGPVPAALQPILPPIQPALPPPAAPASTPAAPPFPPATFVFPTNSLNEAEQTIYDIANDITTNESRPQNFLPGLHPATGAPSIADYLRLRNADMVRELQRRGIIGPIRTHGQFLTKRVFDKKRKNELVAELLVADARGITG